MVLELAVVWNERNLILFTVSKVQVSGHCTNVSSFPEICETQSPSALRSSNRLNEGHWRSLSLKSCKIKLYSDLIEANFTFQCFDRSIQLKSNEERGYCRFVVHLCGLP